MEEEYGRADLVSARQLGAEHENSAKEEGARVRTDSRSHSVAHQTAGSVLTPPVGNSRADQGDALAYCPWIEPPVFLILRVLERR